MVFDLRQSCTTQCLYPSLAAGTPYSMASRMKYSGSGSSTYCLGQLLTSPGDDWLGSSLVGTVVCYLPVLRPVGQISGHSCNMGDVLLYRRLEDLDWRNAADLKTR
jgi:hypothetical protein